MANFDPSIFPKDLTMTLESNHIINEVKEFANREDFIFVPNGGPFYTDSLIIKNTQNGQLLKPIIDYQLLYLNEQATMESNKNVVAVIRVLNTNVPSVNLNYRVIGGEYGNTVAGILQELRNAGPLDNNVDWEINVFKKPEVFPAAPHYHNADDFTDWSNVWVQLEGIRTAIIHSDLPSWASVYRYFDLRLQATTNMYQNMLNGLPQPGYTYNEADAKFVSWDELGSWMGANYYNIGQINTQVNAINNSITSGDQNTLAAAKSYTDTKLATAVANANNYALTVANNSYSAALADSKAYTDSKFSQSTSYANQMLTDAKAYTDSKVAGQNPSVSADALLADPRFQQYKVGDVFTTTTNYADGAAVRAALGYGTWTRYAQGRVIIGQTTAPVVDTAGNSRTFNLGEFGGEYKHTLSVAEMPAHKHTVADTIGTTGQGGGWDLNNSTDNFVEAAGMGSTGGNQPHNNVQPYVVGQYWLRVPDSFKDVTYDLYITSDAAGNNRVTVINEGQDIYLWVDIANSVKGVQLSSILFDKIEEMTMYPGISSPLISLSNGRNRVLSITGDKYKINKQISGYWTLTMTDLYTVMPTTKQRLLAINNDTSNDVITGAPTSSQDINLTGDWLDVFTINPLTYMTGKNGNAGLRVASIEGVTVNHTGNQSAVIKRDGNFVSNIALAGVTWGASPENSFVVSTYDPSEVKEWYRTRMTGMDDNINFNSNNQIIVIDIPIIDTANGETGYQRINISMTSPITYPVNGGGDNSSN